MPFLIGVLVGSIPAAWFAVRLVARKDVSRAGSENVGALNALRVAKSKRLGVTVMAFDCLKGALAVYLAAWWIAGRVVLPFAQPGIDALEFLPLAAAGLGAIAGHNYNPWLSIAQRRLVGGKGFAAASGMLLVLCPWMVPAWLVTVVLSWFAFRAWRGIVDEAPASAVATMAMIPLGYAIYQPDQGVQTAWLGVGMAVLVMPKVVVELRALLFSRTASPDGPTDA